MKPFPVVLLLVIVSAFTGRASVMEEDPYHDREDEDILNQVRDDNDEQQQRTQRNKMAPETQNQIMEAVSAACFDSVHQVLNGELEQKDLSPECNKQLIEGFNQTPLGQLQQKETNAVQTAAFVRLSSFCREQAEQSNQGEGEVQPPQECMDEFQQKAKEMQGWIGMTTLSRLSEECKEQAKTGNLSPECEQELLAVKPGVIDTLNAQTEQKMKEPQKDEKKRNETKPKRERPAKREKPMIEPSFAFFLFWSVLIVGAVSYAFLNSSKLIKPKAKSENGDDDDEEEEEERVEPSEKQKRREQRKKDHKGKKKEMKKLKAAKKM